MPKAFHVDDFIILEIFLGFVHRCSPFPEGTSLTWSARPYMLILLNIGGSKTRDVPLVVNRRQNKNKPSGVLDREAYLVDALNSFILMAAA